MSCSTSSINPSNILLFFPILPSSPSRRLAARDMRQEPLQRVLGSHWISKRHSQPLPSPTQQQPCHHNACPSQHSSVSMSLQSVSRLSTTCQSGYGLLHWAPRGLAGVRLYPVLLSMHAPLRRIHARKRLGESSLDIHVVETASTFSNHYIEQRFLS